MTPEERRLIEDLFGRMSNYGAPDKDREAESLIRERVRAMPDAVYMLTQSVLVQEQALEAANARAQELEDQLREAEDRLRELEERGGAQPRRGFLGGGFADKWRGAEARPSSVPQVGGRATPSTYDRPSSAWGQSPPPPPPPSAPPAAGGGGFMRSAMATAAGVAGGVLAAESIRNMMGSSHAKAAETSASRDDHKSEAERASSSDQDHSNTSQADHSDSDHASHDDADTGYGQDDADTGYDDGGDGDFGDDSIDV